MVENDKLTRREFLTVLGVSTSVMALGACASKKPTPDTPVAATAVAQTIPEKNKPTLAPPAPTTKAVVEPIFPEMVAVEPGTFLMGSEEGHRFEQPVHSVTITRPFYIGVYAVTYAEYDKYSDDIEKSYVGDRDSERGYLPVSSVDWYGAVAYCNWLSEKAGLTPCYSGGGRATKCDFLANGYRLPTEAEWEYAARGGHKSLGYIYAGSDDPDQVGWHAGNSGGSSHPVGQKKPNELGTYDMSGNRWEWCWDWFDEHYYASSPEIDPTGPTEVPKGNFVERSRRSSSAVQSADTIRTAFRSADGVTYAGDNGLRLVTTA